MKKLAILTAMFCLMLQAISVSAATPDFSGTWELDKTKSVLPETMPIESMTLNVSQTQTELKVETTTKRGQNATGAGGAMGGGMRGGAGGGMGGGGGMRGGGAQTIVYSLDGKETTADIGRDVTTGKETKTAKVTSDGKLSLTVVRNLDTQMGSMTMKTNDTWELLDGGKALKITRYSETPRGAFNSVLYFAKKGDAAPATDMKKGDAASMTDPTGAIVKNADGNSTGGSRKISGGILNGKATTLVKPEYPPAARAVKASGAVNVQVTIDEQGNIISASAVSGHPLLRAAAEDAARASKFAPTMLEGAPVTVTGIIVYNFTP